MSPIPDPLEVAADALRRRRTWRAPAESRERLIARIVLEALEEEGFRITPGLGLLEPQHRAGAGGSDE